MGNKRSNSSSSLITYLTSGVVIFGICLGLLLRVPDPGLDWEGFVLPMTNSFMGMDGSNTTPLKGVNVVVSGATSGLGLGLVEAFDRLGANVVALGRNPEKLEQLQKEISSISTVQADYNDLDEVAKAASQINERFNHTVDFVVNNAGIHDGPLLLNNPVSKQGYDRIFSVNYLAHLLLTEKLAPSLSRSERPVVAQMSSSFHWVGDWSDLISTENGGPPPASLPGGKGGIFRTQRGYGDSKLAMIFMTRALKRQNPQLQKARIVSICPAWVGTNIMPPGTMGHLVIKYLGFDPKGWGIASSLYAIFSDAYPKADYFSNAKMLNLVSIENETAHAPWTFLFGLRDLGSFFMAFGALAFNKLTAAAEPSVSSPVTYNEQLQDQIYDWGKQAISDWL